MILNISNNKNNKKVHREWTLLLLIKSSEKSIGHKIIGHLSNQVHIPLNNSIYLLNNYLHILIRLRLASCIIWIVFSKYSLYVVVISMHIESVLSMFICFQHNEVSSRNTTNISRKNKFSSGTEVTLQEQTWSSFCVINGVSLCKWGGWTECVDINCSIHITHTLCQWDLQFSPASTSVRVCPQGNFFFFYLYT